MSYSTETKARGRAHVPRRSATRAVATAAALLMVLGAVGGCAQTSRRPAGSAVAEPAAGAGAQAAGSAGLPAFGSSVLSPNAAGKTVLVVGDSWAASMGRGMSEVAPASTTVVNAGIGGCGIMSPDASTTTAACLAWPNNWPRYMAEYRPDATMLMVGFFDVSPQKLSGDTTAKDLTDPTHRTVFADHLKQAIGVLTAGGTPLYLMDSATDVPAFQASAMAMNVTLREAAAQNPLVHLLDVRGQLCDDSGCPKVLDGINVYDPTRHPTLPARGRLARWALDTMFPA